MSAERTSITPPSLAQDPNLNAIREKASEPGSKYAFLVHSTDSLANGEDPSIDNKPLARQKRRRTSPEDQAILEAAFLQNPKPDKAARMALVDRVALGEKEVQIWFQNRRQSTRRKQRPLDPHEIPPLAYGSAYSSPYGVPLSTDLPSDQQEGRPAQEGKMGILRQIPASTEHQKDASGDKENGSPGDETSHRVTQPDSQTGASASFVEVPSSQPPASSQESSSGRWLSSRRNAAPFRSFHQSMSQMSEPTSQPASQDTLPEPEHARKGLKKSASAIRLSFGADGSAIVRNGDSPSPPRKLPPPPVTPGDSIPGPHLRRSYSSQSLNEPGSQESTKSQSLRRMSSFRSHDSRTWEFFCDRDARSELEERAEQEQSGSAADAIKLARSSSGRRLNRSLSNKRKETPYTEVTSAKRVKTAAPAADTPSTLPSTTPFKEPAQPLMPRSASASNPRRQVPSQTPGQLKHKTPKIKQTPTFDFPATDSDKENWSPERHFNFIQSMTTSPAVPPTTARRRAPPIAHTPLRRGTSPIKGASSSLKRPRMEQVDISDEDDDDDDDVVQFVGETGSARREEPQGRKRQSRQSDSVSEEEDLDCVQGLLSLSQGAWR